MAGISNNLYPPIIDKSFGPAFVSGDSNSDFLAIPFSVSKYNAGIKDAIRTYVQVSIKEQKSNQVPESIKKPLHDILICQTSGSVLKIPAKFFEIGKYYKIQLRFMLIEKHEGQEGSFSFYDFVQYVNDDSKKNNFNSYEHRFWKMNESGEKTGNIKLEEEFPNCYTIVRQNAGLTDNEATDIGTLSRQYTNQSAEDVFQEYLADHLNSFSEWSEVLIVKRIGNPVVTINSFEATDENKTFCNLKQAEITGNIIFQNDNTQRLKYYQLQLLNNNNKVLDSSDIIYNDFSKIKDQFGYTFKYELEENVKYKLKFIYTTTNYYNSYVEYPFMVDFQFYRAFEGSIATETQNNLGRIKISIENNEKLYEIGTNIIVKRASSKDKFKIWQEIFIFIVEPDTYLSKILYDYTVQSGVWYKYSAQERYTQGFDSSSIQTAYAVMPEFEDIFLVAEGKQLKVRFNPSVSNYSHVVAEGLTQTIGSKYPFIRRNGKVNYRTFSLSGLITSFMDIDANLIDASKNDLYKTSQIVNLYKTYNTNNNITAYNDYIYEKEFRQKVISFLYKNNIKLYKSTTQGNILVKLMNISLTPDETLSRFLYSFNCTVTEVVPFNYENCIKYRIQDKGSFVDWDGNNFSIQGQLFIANTKGSQENDYISKNNIVDVEAGLINKNTMNRLYIKKSTQSIDVKFKYFSSLKFHYFDKNLNSQTDGEKYKINIQFSNETAEEVKLGYNGIYEITSTDNLRITSFSVSGLNNTDIMEVQYQAVFSEQEKTDLYPISYSTEKVVGQFWRTFNSNISIYKLIEDKYERKQNEDRIKIALQKINGVRVTAEPGTAILVREQQDSSLEKFLIGETGILEFFDDETFIKDLYISHIELYPTTKINPRINEFYNNGTTTSNQNNCLWTTTEDNNTIYHIKYKGQTYQGDDIEVTTSNNEIVKVVLHPSEIQAIVDYTCTIIKEVYA